MVWFLKDVCLTMLKNTVKIDNYSTLRYSKQKGISRASYDKLTSSTSYSLLLCKCYLYLKTGFVLAVAWYSFPICLRGKLSPNQVKIVLKYGSNSFHSESRNTKLHLDIENVLYLESCMHRSKLYFKFLYTKFQQNLLFNVTPVTDIMATEVESKPIQTALFQIAVTNRLDSERLLFIA